MISHPFMTKTTQWLFLENLDDININYCRVPVYKLNVLCFLLINNFNMLVQRSRLLSIQLWTSLNKSSFLVLYVITYKIFRYLYFTLVFNTILASLTSLRASFWPIINDCMIVEHCQMQNLLSGKNIKFLFLSCRRDKRTKHFFMLQKSI